MAILICLLAMRCCLPQPISAQPQSQPFLMNFDYSRFRSTADAGYLELYYSFYCGQITFHPAGESLKGGVALRTDLIDAQTGQVVIIDTTKVYTVDYEMIDDGGAVVKTVSRQRRYQPPALRAEPVSTPTSLAVAIETLTAKEIEDEFQKARYLADKTEIDFFSQLKTPQAQKDFLDEVERHASEGVSKPYEIWYYYQIKNGVQFIFLDKNGFGDYDLVHSTKRGELYDEGWSRFLQ